MSLFKKKCEYCKEKIDKGKEIFRNVKDTVFIGTKQRAFCCGEHADSYEKEVKDCCKGSKGGCCG